jgi:hypothetical protein
MERDLIPSDQKPVQPEGQTSRERPVETERKAHLSKRSLEVKARLQRLRESRVLGPEIWNLQLD